MSETRVISPVIPFRLGYRPALDGLRALAVLFVMFSHFYGWLPGGFIGVDIFMVLSGFLITSLLLEESQATQTLILRRFYLRRAIRLLPALVFLLLVRLVYQAFWPMPGSWRNVWLNILGILCYQANWAAAWQFYPPDGLLCHCWSLSLEEQFYLVWPLVLLLMCRLRLPLTSILILLTSGIIGSALWRASLWTGLDHRLRLYVCLDTRADAFLIGSLLAFLFAGGVIVGHAQALRLFRAAGPVGVASLVCLAITLDGRTAPVYRVFFTVADLLAALVIGMVMAAPGAIFSGLLRKQPLVWIGRISYGLYLWHYPVFIACRRAGTQDWHRVADFSAQFGFTLAAASLSYYAIERPFLRLKSRLAVGAPPAVVAHRLAA
jgi:peptidoglycan/LPS O-acetylase OafA/YrhL